MCKHMKVVTLYIALVAFIALFPKNVDALYFILNQGYTECIHFHAKARDHFIGSFEVDSAYEGVRVSLLEVDSNSQIMDKIENSGEFSINAQKDTEYKLCFKNLMNSVQQTVNFSIKNVSYNSKINDIMSNIESKKLLESMESLYERISIASEKQKYSLSRKIFQMEAIESSRKKAALWSIFQLLVSFGWVAVQIYYIKSYFQVKYLV